MASIDWKKATTQKAGAMKRHLGKKERMNVKHANTNIDKSKTHLNTYIGADDYAPMLDKVKARIKEVDKKYPPKRDLGKRRITCILLETPVPLELSEQGKASEFLLAAHKVIEVFFGKENVGGTCCHFDEQHTYIGKDEKEHLSVVHGHTLCAAYAEWKDEKTGEQRIGINGKHCETKTRLKALNKAMNEMCLKEFSINYNTSETPERKSVERLKAETRLREEAEKQKRIIAKNAETIAMQEKEISERAEILTELPRKPKPPADFPFQTKEQWIEGYEYTDKYGNALTGRALRKAKKDEEKSGRYEEIFSCWINYHKELDEWNALYENAEKIKSIANDLKRLTDEIRVTKQKYNADLDDLKHQKQQYYEELRRGIEKGIAADKRTTELAERRTAAMKARIKIAPAFKARYNSIFTNKNHSERRTNHDHKPFDAKPYGHNTARQKQI